MKNRRLFLALSEVLKTTPEETEKTLSRLAETVGFKDYTIKRVGINSHRDEWHILLPFPTTLNPDITDRQLYNVPIYKEFKRLVLSTFLIRCYDYQILTAHGDKEKFIRIIVRISR